MKESILVLLQAILTLKSQKNLAVPSLIYQNKTYNISDNTNITVETTLG